MGYGWNDGGWGWGAWLAMALLMVVFWSVVVVVVLAVFRHFRDDSRAPDRRPERGPDRHDALQILDERFARGEIDEEEYKRRRDLLKVP